MNEQYRVLVVDDERDTRRLLCEGIASLGGRYMVSGVPSGEEAQLELARTLPHLLVTDVRLAGISGLELLRRVRARNADLKVIVITGLDNLDIRRQALESGADAFFTQPVDMGDFLEKVRSLVNGASPREKSKEQPAVVEAEESLASEEKFSAKLEEFSEAIAARAAIVLDHSGHAYCSSGHARELDFEADFLHDLMQSSRAGAALTNSRDWDLHANLQVFFGESRIYLLSPLEMDFTLFIALSASGFDAVQAGGFDKLLAMIKELNDFLALSSSDDQNEQDLYAPVDDEWIAIEQKEAEILVEPDHNMEEIFKGSGQIKFSSNDVDQFWDDLVSEADEQYYHSGNMISYEQAKRMGLAPGDEGD